MAKDLTGRFGPILVKNRTSRAEAVETYRNHKFEGKPELLVAEKRTTILGKIRYSIEYHPALDCHA